MEKTEIQNKERRELCNHLMERTQTGLKARDGVSDRWVPPPIKTKQSLPPSQNTVSVVQNSQLNLEA